MTLDPMKLALVCGLVAGCMTSLVRLRAQDPRNAIHAPDPSFRAEEGKAVRLGAISILTLETSFWRDWMPVVSNPGPDGGSPLRGNLRFWIENHGAERRTVTCSVVIVDANGRSHPVPFRVQPNFRVLGDKAAGAYRDGDVTERTKLIAEHRVMWDGVVNAGEGREVVLSLDDGPCLPAGSRVHAEVAWRDAEGRAVLVKTQEASIRRTD